MEHLLQLTKQLITAGDEAVARFYMMREEDRVPDFYEEVKPYADEMREVVTSWRALCEQFIEEHSPKYMHMVQINHAIDAMEQYFVQSFFKETSKKRFIQSVQSTKYTLETLYRTIQEV